MKEQAAWNRYVADVCWLGEESQWIDLETLRRDDGSARGYAEIGCELTSAVERAYYARARRLADAGGLARRVTAAAAAPARRHLEAVLDAVQKPKPAVEPEGRPWPLEAAQVRELGARAGAVRDGARELGRATCAGWPELAQAVGASACATALEAYYLALLPLPGP
jgi:hypothetical protein